MPHHVASPWGGLSGHMLACMPFWLKLGLSLLARIGSIQFVVGGRIAWTTIPGLPVFRQCQVFLVLFLLFAGGGCARLGVTSVWVPTIVGGVGLGADGWG